MFYPTPRKIFAWFFIATAAIGLLLFMPANKPAMRQSETGGAYDASAPASQERDADFKSESATKVANHSRTNSIRMRHKTDYTPAWATPYGQEFWQQRNPIEKPFKQTQTPADFLHGIDIANAIERVTHAFTMAEDGASAQVSGNGYVATVGQEGLTIAASAQATASDKQSKESNASVFRTTQVRRGNETYVTPIDAHSPVWSVLGDTAQAPLDDKEQVVQHLQAGSRGIEAAWIFARIPDGSGVLEIDSEIKGLWSMAETSSGLHFADASGCARLCVGPAKAVDSRGRTWNLAMTAIENTIRISVPESVLAQAAYPLAIDPLISPESGVDNPVAGPAICAQAAPVTAFRGEICLVIWTRGQSDSTSPVVLGARLDAKGELLDPFGIVLGMTAAENTTAAVAANAAGFLAIWSGPKGASVSDWDIYGAFVGTDGSVTAIPALCQAAGAQSCPALAAGETNFFASWYDNRNTGIYGTLVSSNGVAVNPGGVALTTAVNSQYTPTVAALGSQYLVAWQDYRNSTATQFHAGIYGARISAQGQVLDPKGIAICVRTNLSQWSPSAAACNGNYLVVWEDYNIAGNDLFMARVGTNGLVLDTNPIPLCLAAGGQSYPSLSSDGTNIVAVWQDYRNSLNRHADIYADRIDTNAAATGSFLVSQAEDGQWRPSAAVSNGKIQFVWQDLRANKETMRYEVYGKRLAVSADAPPLRLISRTPNQELTPVICAGVSNYWVAWSDNRNQAVTGFDIFGMRLDAKGQALDIQAIPICVVAGNQTVPTLSANGDGCMVTWTDIRNATNSAGGDIYAAWLDNAGTIVKEFVVCSAIGDQTAPAISASVAASEPFRVVWQDARASATNTVQWDIYGARVSAPGTVLDEFPICATSPPQTVPAVAASLNQWLVAWEDKRNGTTTDIYGARVSAAGAVIDPDGFGISTAVSNQLLPAVAGNQTGFVVVWADQRVSSKGLDIYAARANAAGSVLDSTGVAVRSALQYQTAPAVATDGGEYAIVWQDALIQNTNNYNLAGAVLDNTGTVLPTWFANTNTFDQKIPSIAFLGGRYLMVAQGPRLLTSRAIAQLIVMEPRIANPTRLANGDFQFDISASPGLRVSIEVSEDLATWTTTSTFTNIQGAARMIDSKTSNSVQRYYRVVASP